MLLRYYVTSVFFRSVKREELLSKIVSLTCKHIHRMLRGSRSTVNDSNSFQCTGPHNEKFIRLTLDL